MFCCKMSQKYGFADAGVLKIISKAITVRYVLQCVIVVFRFALKFCHCSIRCV